jgi:beta-lactamase regulating signal transducer with metallopeptidase domain
MMTAFLQVASLAAERVLNAIPGGLLIAALAWLLLRLVGRQSSGMRFAVWFGALLAVAGLPFVPSVSKAGAAMQVVRSEIVLPGIWAVGIFAVWISIAALATVRIVVGLWKLRRLRNGAVPLAVSSVPSEVVAQFQSPRRVMVCSSPAVTVPTAIGFFKPVILIPDWVLRDLSEEELKVILLHEFAHLQRFDDWTNLTQKLVRTVFFFHPAVWWIEKRLSLEREIACDEAVVAETENPQAYAKCLVALAEKSFFRRGLALTQAVVGRAGETALRLARILDGKPKSPRGLKPAWGLVALFGVCCLVGSSDAPRLISFENVGPAPVIDSNSSSIAAAGDAASQKPQTAVTQAVARTAEVPLHPSATRKNVVAGIYRPVKFSEARGAKQREAHPVLVAARAQKEIVAPQFQLVMQVTGYDEGGSQIMSLCVWRVTFENENHHTVRQEVIVRSL